MRLALGLLLYVFSFFLLLHLVDRLASREPPAGPHEEGEG